MEYTQWHSQDGIFGEIGWEGDKTGSGQGGVAMR